jgi:hypothetical protein
MRKDSENFSTPVRSAVVTWIFSAAKIEFKHDCNSSIIDVPNVEALTISKLVLLLFVQARI